MEFHTLVTEYFSWSPKPIETLSRNALQHLHCCNLAMAPTLTTSKVFNHNQNILIMSNNKTQWVGKT
jgi:hypothetical protein